MPDSTGAVELGASKSEAPAPSMMESMRIAYAQVIRSYAMGLDDLHVDVGFIVLPSPQGMSTSYCLIGNARGSLLGPQYRVSHSQPILPGIPGNPIIIQNCVAMCEQLRANKAAQAPENHQGDMWPK